jgi:ABC-2 type transport system ATP-binding protein
VAVIGAGVDVHNRGLFWELIQDEAQAGVTVFVTTHFLEEVDYCDWVCFIDAGRLIANAEPETLRQRYSYGYRIDVDVAADARAGAAALLGTAGRRVEDTGSGVQLSVPALDPEVLALLDRFVDAHPLARVRIEQAQMTDVFRRVLAESGAAL